jgi:hypothetical protein
LILSSTVSAQTNIALNKPVLVSSASPQFPAKNMVDGKISRNSKWEAGSNRAPHTIEIDLQKYFEISAIKIHSGILDDEKKADETSQAAGFWSVKNFKLQYWDDANWTDLPNSEVLENRLTTAVFTFNPVVTTSRLRMVVSDGEKINIMEFEAFGTAALGMGNPPSISSERQNWSDSASAHTTTITVTKEVAGKSMQFVGYNQGFYIPGSNVSGWLEYSNVNSLRVWAALNSFVPASAVQVDTAMSSLQVFEERKNRLRKTPEGNEYINWQALYPLYEKLDSSSTNAMIFNYALAELKRLKIKPVLQINTTEFEDNWANKWKQWQRYYALAYYAAKTGDVAMFAMQNEPNHRHSGPMTLNQWIMGMQIVSDAVHAAVADVNKKYDKKLEAKFVGPVTAGQNTEWWAGVSKAIRTGYDGKQTDKDLIDIFSTHSYNNPAAGYEERVNNIRKIIMGNHPEKKPLPIVFTEIGRWMNAYLIDKEETMDSPSLFVEWAGIYSNNMKNGAYGMWAFKFANTNSGAYPRGIKSGHHYTWHGKRIVEDAYKNLAAGKPVRSSAALHNSNSALITDGIKSDNSQWISDSTGAEKWVEIDLGAVQSVGSAVVYTGSAAGVYTGPDRISNFKLQYLDNNSWKDIPGAQEKDCKYVQVFFEFKTPVKTRRIKFLSTDNSTIRLREIKLFGPADRPSNEPNYDISGIQRTGEVVRLFAKGFKEQRPLLLTKSTVKDNGLDHYTSYDEKSGNYYIWLVQRGLFDYKLKIDLSALKLRVGTPVIAETVDEFNYGEVTDLHTLSPSNPLAFNLKKQSVVLLTIPAGGQLVKTNKTATSAATVTGPNGSESMKSRPGLYVELNAAAPAKNKVAYLQFNLTGQDQKEVKLALLELKGKVNEGKERFRIHVYAFASDKIDPKILDWQNAPYLDSKEALIKKVGLDVAMAGELSFSETDELHRLDVTKIVNKNKGRHLTFVLIRETRQLGDDSDKNRSLIIKSLETDNKPTLTLWTLN